MRPLIKIPRSVLLYAALALACLPRPGYSADMVSTNVIGGNTGWFTANTWKTNDGLGNPIGPFVAGHPAAGNTYTLVQGPNPAIGNNQNETRTRNLYTNGTPTPLWTFPGDSLTLTTNTEIRFKQIATPATIETVNFPGVGGNPGLILNGGMLNVGDAIIQPVAGIIQAVPGSQSYLCPGNNDGASADTARALTISAKIVGSGTLCVFMAATNNPQRINSTNNTYSGLWLVKAGRLLGASPGSLGTNSNFTMDPNYVLPVPPFSSTVPVVDVAGPAVLEAGYDLNSAGVLILTNGGKMRLHQNCAFTSVIINGAALGSGTHYFSELIANFPSSFDPGGSGAITVQPYGNLPALGPIILTQPGPQRLYAGRTAHFSATADANGAPPLTFQWQRYGTNLIDGGNISGATNATLTVSSVGAADATGYNVVVANTIGSINSTTNALTIVSPTGEAYEAAALAANVAVFYQLSETGDPATNNSPVFDFAGGFNGTYGTAVQNGNPNYNIAGPTPAAGYPGFSGANTAAQFANANVNSRVTVTPWNLNTNSVTLTAWINPNGPQNPNEGLVICRGGGTVAGLCYAGALDPFGNANIGYNWNNEYETYNWVSGLTAPAGQWSLVVAVITPTTATIHVMNTNGVQSATHLYSHVVQAFGGTTTIGDDSGGASGNRVFNGAIDDVGVFQYALSKAQLYTLFTNGIGVTNFPPVISGQPTNQSPYAGQTAIFAASGGGTDPLTYQWQSGASGSGVYTNVPNGGRFSGAATETLSIANITTDDSLDYVLRLSNPYGVTTSSVANLSVQGTSAAENITMPGVLQPAPLDWDTSGNWSDGQPASVSAAAKPGSTYELLPSGGLNTRMRSPQNPRTAIFPGNVLTVSGNAIWTNNPATNGNTSEIRFKQPNPGIVIFKKLVMNGGQLDAGNDGIVEVAGELNVLTNCPIYNDNGADRGYLISSWLTGAGSIEYHGYNQTTFQSNYVNNLNIACTSNTFSGKWNIALGTLLGTGTNCLGTNDIVVGTSGAIETTYNINNTNSSFFLSGRMYLHQNHTFRSVFVNGVPLAVGTYTFAQLNLAYPTNFPNAWMPQIGAASYTNGGSGSITVLVQPVPQITTQPVSVSVFPTQNAQFTVAAQGNPPLFYYWRKGGVILTDSGNLSGSTTTNLVITNVVGGNGGNYDVVVSNSVGSVTSVVASLTVLPTGPPLNLTLDFGGTPIVQPQNTDWETPSNWSDGNPASYSSLTNPGSTYEVVAGARLRSPANAASSTFPGVQLTVDGDGVFVNNNGPTIGEIRFKHANPGAVFFQRLIMNGGQLDTGDNGFVTIQGRMDILANTPIYVDNAANDTTRGYNLQAWLTGNGSIEYHAFGNTLGGIEDLNIMGTTNTYSGPWHVVQGTLLGSGASSLGTNSITVENGGALETLYNLNNPSASLTLNGAMLLHNSDTFRAVTVGGAPIPPGTYTFARLNASYPANFPSTWPIQTGSSFSTGSGSLTVLTGPPILPVTMSFEASGGNLTISGGNGIPSGHYYLLSTTNVSLPRASWTRQGPNAFDGSGNFSTSIPIDPSSPQQFFLLQQQVP